ncbi:hypothetical protein [Sphingomonas sp. SORGH_AS_0438]|jgi:hypothetical protein|uniref:hypothetical protein n=1 Tax=Sphingomonas sp. SORGH_AS_0438 TaxID=3041756 RepID=UPI002855E6A5|nr:hypothetical protein [Sphingomonas sp. SORGH_AS_0438]MDR6129093.1 hypothetical protein [Sphingomonas sp. SORGH_AS_0438]
MKLAVYMMAMLASAPALAADQPPAPTVMTVEGEQGFDVKCHVWPRGGDETVRFLDKSRPSLSVNGVWRLECEYKGSSRGPITISLKSPTLPCPFKDSSAEACTTTVRKGGVGSFEVREKRS